MLGALEAGAGYLGERQSLPLTTTQTIQVSHIGSSFNAGTPTFSKQAQPAYYTGLGSARVGAAPAGGSVAGFLGSGTLGTAQIVSGAGAIASLEALGSISIYIYSGALKPSGIASAEALGSITVLSYAVGSGRGARVPKAGITAAWGGGTSLSGVTLRDLVFSSEMTFGAGCDIRRCIFHQPVHWLDAATLMVEDCYFDYNGSAKTPWDFNGTGVGTDGLIQYCTLSGFNDIGPVLDGPTHDLTIRKIMLRPALAPLSLNRTIGPVASVGSAESIGTPTVTKSRKIQLTGIASVSVVNPIIIPTVGGKMARISAYSSNPPANINEPDNWVSHYVDTENSEHGWRPSLFPGRTTVVGDIVMNSTESVPRLVANRYGIGGGSFPAGTVGVFPGALGSNTTIYRDPVLSAYFGHDVNYDVSGWIYIRNLKLRGSVAVTGRGTGPTGQKILVENFHVQNYAVDLGIDPTDSSAFAMEPYSGTMNFNSVQVKQVSVLVDHSPNGDTAIQYNSSDFSETAVHIKRAGQDCWKAGGQSRGWRAFVIDENHPAERDFLDNTPLYGVARLNVGVDARVEVRSLQTFSPTPDGNSDNSDIGIWLKADIANNPTPIVAYQVIPITLHDLGTAGGAWTGNLRTIIVHLATTSAGAPTTTAAQLVTAINNDPTASALVEAHLFESLFGAGLMDQWTLDKTDGFVPDRLQIPNAKNHLVGHSDTMQVFSWDNSTVCPFVNPDGTLTDSGERFDAAHGFHDPNYPGKLGTCVFSRVCIRGNHAARYHQGSAKNGDGNPSKRIVGHKERHHASNQWIAVADCQGAGTIDCHLATLDYPGQIKSYFTNAPGVPKVALDCLYSDTWTTAVSTA